jgi:hypothetical protein
MTEATEAEMIDHCDRYACFECPLVPRCGMYKKLKALTTFKISDHVGFCGDNNRTPQCEKNGKTP